MREKAEIFFDAVTYIRPELVEEAQNYVFRRRTVWRRLVPLAACLTLAVCLGWYGLLFYGGFGGMGVANDCGSIGGATSTDSNSAPPPAAEESAPPAESMPPPCAEPTSPAYGEEGWNPVGGGKPEAIPGDTAPSDAAPEERVFTARVVEMGEESVLVRPLPGGDLPAGTDRAEVVLEDLAALPEIQAGDKVRVTFTGEIQETYPLRITGVTEITLEER